MDNEPTDIKSIFWHAIEKKDVKERAGYIDGVCENNPELRAKVEELLRLHDNAGDFLESPILASDVTLDDTPISEGPGSTVGRYKLLEKIGEGGMAVVYMAEQAEPIRRKVALKIIKLGMDTKQVIARFEAERQALAIMDHPNIARILDAGATETGRPYFVMELVTDLPITEYCDKNSLTTIERLELFIQVCNAVQHAHQKGIIHRDIKPTNVMVNLHDGKPVPKVIDFGIAKAINRKLTEKTLLTRYAHMIGTPAYMSPEQAEMSDLYIDTRTDVYSLGVLLYELLTGTTPFDAEVLGKASPSEIQRIICEQEPTKPSTKLSSFGEKLTGVAEQHRETPEALRKLIRGDLDWIVMKCLQKDRDRRYDTASALVIDIQRHLNHEPVEARAPGAVYHLQKFLRRHRSQAITAATIAILIGAVTAVLSMWIQKRLQFAQTESYTHRNILSQARDLFSRRDLPAALKAVKSIIDSEHVGPEARVLYAGILVEGQQPEAATATLEDLLDESPEVAGIAYSLLARILWESESSDSEKRGRLSEYEKKTKELLPETADAYFLQALTAQTIKEKLELLDRAVRLKPSHYESRRLRAFTYSASKKHEEMEHDALAMIVLLPDDPLGYSLRATALRQLGLYHDAIADYDRAIELAPIEDPQRTELCAERCQLYLQMGQYDRVISDAQRYLKTSSDGAILHFHIFCARIALGDYDEAAVLYHRIAGSDLDSRRSFRDWSMKYVFDSLEAGRSWHPPDSKPQGVAFLPMLEAEETYYHLSAKAERLIVDGFSADWSPDGTKMVFSPGIPGYSGVAIFDPATQETDLLITPGKNPKWSPDGRYIAFVRDCRVLPLSELVATGPSSEYRSYQGEEIWIMNADGTSPRRLAKGKWPSWSRDSSHVYYQRIGVGPYRISVEDTNAESKLVVRYLWDYCSVSPDEIYMAGAAIGSLQIKDIASQSLVAEWTGPLTMWGGNWHPEGHEFSMGGINNAEDRAGLWIYDMEKGRAEKGLSGQISSASWAPEGTQLAITLAAPYHEIWVAGLDPNVSTVEALGTGGTLEEHYQEMVDHYTRIIETDPKDAENYRRRAQYYDYLHDEERVAADIDMYVALLKSSDIASAHDRWVRDLLVRLCQSTPKNLGPPIKSPYGESGPSISADGLTLFFASGRAGGLGAGDLWFATRPTTEADWAVPVNLGATVNSPFSERSACISRDGLSLFFASHRREGRSDLWVTTRPSTDDPWSEPVNLGPTVNSDPFDDIFPSISADGLSLFFDSARPGGYGGYDIWVTTRKSKHDEWESPVNLGPSVNSADLDGGPCISADGRTLFFMSRRPGGYGWLDIMVTRRETTDGPWSEPANLGPAVNSRYGEITPSISADGSTLFFSRGLFEGPPDFDLWQVSIDPISGSSPQDNDDSARTTAESNNGKEG